ncbi:MAG: hotdog domain-containing protein [Variovorax sp.]
MTATYNSAFAEGRRSDPEVVLRVIPMPADAVQDNTISAGWVMSKLDQAGSVLPARLSGRRFALIAVDKLEFAKPVLLGDIVTFLAFVRKVGITSLSVEVQATTERRDGSEKQVVTSCVMTYVALDECGHAVPIL